MDSSTVLTEHKSMDLKEILKQPVTFRRKVFKLFGNELSVFDPAGQVVMFVKQKAFKLREDIRVYSDKSMSKEVLYIQARNILDMSATYDVTDQTAGEKVGALRRKGIMSTFVSDRWEMLDNNENVIGEISEDNVALALIRRYLINLIPQSFDFASNGLKIAQLKQRFNPFILKADFQMLNKDADSRLTVAGAVLMLCIEGRQGSGQ